MSDNDVSHAVFIVNLQLIHDHKHYKDAHETARSTTVVYITFSQLVWVLALYRSLVPHVALIMGFKCLATQTAWSIAPCYLAIINILLHLRLLQTNGSEPGERRYIFLQ